MCSGAGWRSPCRSSSASRSWSRTSRAPAPPSRATPSFARRPTATPSGCRTSPPTQINAALYAKLPYDSVKDFTYIAMIASTPLMLVVHPSTNAHSVRELIALLKATSGKLSYGSSGNGTIVHLAGEMLRQAAGVEILHVRYKGSNPATQAILGGEVTFVFSTMPPAIANSKAGKLRALAVTTPKRVSAAPDVPTMMEAGVPNFEIVLYSGVLGPKGMDRAI